MKAFNVFRDRAFRLMVFHAAMTHLAVSLALSALAAGIYQSRVYFSFAACASGVILIGKAWFDYCAFRDGKPLREKEGKVPYMLKNKKSPKRYRPAFLMNSRDFDDDLTPMTAFSAEDFSLSQRRLGSMAACLLSGCLMTLLSFLL